MTGSDWLRLGLSSTELPDGVAFTIDFVNSSEELQVLHFSEDESEAARRGLRIRMGDHVLDPVEYQLINRKPGTAPAIPVSPGQGHRFTLTGRWEKRLLRFGHTGYLVHPGAYTVVFKYIQAESNGLAWIVK